MVTTRPEHEAAQNEYEPFLVQSSLSRDNLRHVVLEKIGLLDFFTTVDVSEVLIGASPYNADTPMAEKTHSQPSAGEQTHELSGAILKEGIPLLVTGVTLQVLTVYLGIETQKEFGEELSAVDLFLMIKGCEDPVLKRPPQAVTTLADHYEGVGKVPAYATLLASSPDYPVQMLRVGRSVYACQFNSEFDTVQFERRISIYSGAGHGDPDTSEDILAQAWSFETYDAGQIIHDFISHFSRN